MIRGLQVVSYKLDNSCMGIHCHHVKGYSGSILVGLASSWMYQFRRHCLKQGDYCICYLSYPDIIVVDNCSYKICGKQSPMKMNLIKLIEFLYFWMSISSFILKKNACLLDPHSCHIQILSLPSLDKELLSAHAQCLGSLTGLRADLEKWGMATNNP